jgi:hypothetical protein
LKNLSAAIARDLANELNATSIDDRSLFRLFAGKSSRDDLGLLQHNRHEAAVPAVPTNVQSWG